MQDVLATELYHVTSRERCPDAHVAYRLRLSVLESVEQRRRHGIEELVVTVGCGMRVVRHISRRPFAGTVVYRSERIHGRHIPLVYQEIHAFDVLVVVKGVVSARIVVHHNRYLPVFAYLSYYLLHVVTELLHECLFVGSLVYALISHGQTYDDIASEVVYELVVAVEQVLRVVSSYRHARYGERIVALLSLITCAHQVTVKIGVAMEVGGSLSVGYG